MFFKSIAQQSCSHGAPPRLESSWSRTTFLSRWLRWQNCVTWVEGSDMFLFHFVNPSVMWSMIKVSAFVMCKHRCAYIYIFIYKCVCMWQITRHVHTIWSVCVFRSYKYHNGCVHDIIKHSCPPMQSWKRKRDSSTRTVSPCNLGSFSIELWVKGGRTSLLVM